MADAQHRHPHGARLLAPSHLPDKSRGDCICGVHIFAGDYLLRLIGWA
jgi:hypothetical protein